MKVNRAGLVTLDDVEAIWSRFFMVSPLVVVGTMEGEGYNLAPKHMAMPLGWDNYFGFVCTRRHATYQNIRQSGFFTVSFPKPSQVVLASLSAAPRIGEDEEKATLKHLPTFPAKEIEGILLEDAYLYLECKMDRIVDGFGNQSLIVGCVKAAHVDGAYARQSEVDDGSLINEAPLLAYLSPGRYAAIDDTKAFPFPAGFER